MCKLCVSEGLLTQQELDDLVAAGDRSVIAYSDRIHSGENPQELLESLDMTARLLGFSDIESLLDAAARNRARGSN